MAPGRYASRTPRLAAPRSPYDPRPVDEPFYEPDGERFAATEWTRGPWDADAQHAGPPAALIGRAIERLPSDEPLQVARITFEVLRPVPIAPLSVAAEVVRPGRRVELVEARIEDPGGEAVMRARGWRLRRGVVAVPDFLTSAGGGPGPQAPAGTLAPGQGPPGPEAGEAREFFATGHEVGYHAAMEYRFTSGAFTEPGPAVAWMRMRGPLVAGEEPSPLERVLVAADSGNGISATLDWRRFTFVNVDLSVHLGRMPEGEWVCLASITLPERTGIGLADTALYDQRGPIGRADQTLLVQPRAAGEAG